MTVAELIAELQKMPQDAQVFMPNLMEVDIVLRTAGIGAIVIVGHMSEDRAARCELRDVKLPEGI